MVLCSPFSDILDDKTKEQLILELNDSNKLLSNIIEFYPDPTLIIDNDGKVIAWNKAIEEMTGVMAEEMIGKSNYEYALPFYGQRKPLLINLVDLPPAEINERYKDVRIHNGRLEALAVKAKLRGKDVVIWATACKLYDSEGKVVGAIESIRDVTGQKRNEEARHESEQRLADIIDFLPDATFAIDRDGIIVAWNRAIEEMTGVKAKDVLGKGDHEYSMPFYGIREPILIDLAFKYDKNIEKKYSYVKKEGDVLLAETEMYRNDEIRALWGKAVPLYDSRGNIVGAIESIRDITDQKRIEKALREHINFLQVLMNAIPAPIFYKNVDGVYLGCNVAFEKFIGLTKEQIVGKTVYDVSPKELADIFREADLTLFRKGGVQEYESRVNYADCIQHDVIFYKAPFFNADGVLGGLIGTVLDITERKHAEEELRRHKDHLEELVVQRTADLKKVNGSLMKEIIERKSIEEALKKSENFLQNVFECIQDGISILDKDLNIIHVNHTMDEWYSRMIPLAGKKCYIAYHEKSEPCENCPSIRAIKEKTRQTGIVPYTRPDGITGWMELYSFPLLDDEGNVIGVIEHVRNITDRKQAENAVIEAKAQAELYLDLMGHDINNLNQIGIGFLELALDTLNLNEEGRSIISKPLAALESSSRLIDNVRKIQKAKSGELRYREMDVGQALADVQAYYSHIPGRNVTINYTPVSGRMVMANELLYDVFSNLVGNAIKHSTRTLSINIGLEKWHENGKLYHKIIVEDNGPGISDEFKPRIFDRHLRGSTKAKGSGIGLYLVKTLVESYNGRAWVEDRVQGDMSMGSRFVVMLPAYE